MKLCLGAMCTSISSDATLQKYNSLLSMLRYQRPEAQLCGLSHQSNDDDSSTHFTAWGQERRVRRDRSTVYPSYDFYLHIKRGSNLSG